MRGQKQHAIMKPKKFCFRFRSPKKNMAPHIRLQFKVSADKGQGPLCCGKTPRSRQKGEKKNTNKKKKQVFRTYGLSEHGESPQAAR